MLSTYRLHRPVSVVLGMLVIAGCTSDSGTIESAPGPSWTEVSTKPAWELEGYTVFGDVTSAGEMFTLYALNPDDELMALGIDAETGERRWEYFATYSSTIGGVQFEIATSGARAVFMQVTDLENSFPWPEIAMIDADSGVISWRYYGGAVVAAPWFCGDDEEFVCFTAWQESDDGAGYQQVVLDAEEGTLVSSTRLADPRRIGIELFTDGDGSLLHIDHDGIEYWRAPISELFGSDDLDPDNGWHFELHEDGFYYGDLGVNATTEEAEYSEKDMGRSAMAAFDQQTGESKWIEAGTGDCWNIDFTEEAPVRCRTNGTIINADGERSFEGTASIEGFDPVTGVTTWTWEAEGLGEALFAEDDAILQVSETVYLLVLPGGNVLIDLETGVTSPAVDQVPLWCSATEYVQPGRSIHDDDNYNQRATVNRWPCDQDGAPTGEVVTVPDFAGETVDDYFAWIDDGQLQAVRILD